MKYVYPAIFTPTGNDVYSVHIPDLPGCRTFGNSLLYPLTSRLYNDSPSSRAAFSAAWPSISPISFTPTAKTSPAFSMPK